MAKRFGPRTDSPEPRGRARPAPSRAATPAEAAAAAKFAYNPALDGMRVICIFFILAGHMGAIRTSNVAVDVFFVLSGFLITSLLIAERSRTGTVSVGRFLVRRAFRLMPGLWVYLLVGLAVTVAFKWDDIPFREDYFGSAVSAFFNVNNWFKIQNPEAGGRWLAHVWSLSLEEQFYLLWPALFLLFSRSRRLAPHLMAFLLVALAVVTAWAYYLATSAGVPRLRIYFGLDTHVAPLLIGCLLALWRDRRLRALAVPVGGDGEQDGAAGDGKGRARPGGVSPLTAAAAARWKTGQRIAAFGLPAGIALVLLAFLGPDKEAHDPNWLDMTAYLPSALLGAALILGADLRRDARWVRLVGAPRMAWAGKITFGIYLWHYPVISAANGQLVPRIGLWPSVIVAMVVSVIVAYFSSRFVEKPAQRRRPKWADTPRGPARPAAGKDAVPGQDSGREETARKLVPAQTGPLEVPVPAAVGAARRDAGGFDEDIERTGEWDRPSFAGHGWDDHRSQGYRAGDYGADRYEAGGYGPGGHDWDGYDPGGRDYWRDGDWQDGDQADQQVEWIDEGLPEDRFSRLGTDPATAPHARSWDDGRGHAGYERAGYERAGYANAGYANTGYANTGYEDAGYQAGYQTAHQDGCHQDGYESRAGGYDSYDGYGHPGYEQDAHPHPGYGRERPGGHQEPAWGTGDHGSAPARGNGEADRRLVYAELVQDTGPDGWQEYRGVSEPTPVPGWAAAPPGWSEPAPETLRIRIPGRQRPRGGQQPPAGGQVPPPGGAGWGAPGGGPDDYPYPGDPHYPNGYDQPYRGRYPGHPSQPAGGYADPRPGARHQAGPDAGGRW